MNLTDRMVDVSAFYRSEKGLNPESVKFTQFVNNSVPLQPETVPWCKLWKWTRLNDIPVNKTKNCFFCRCFSDTY